MKLENNLTSNQIFQLTKLKIPHHNISQKQQKLGLQCYLKVLSVLFLDTFCSCISTEKSTHNIAQKQQKLGLQCHLKVLSVLFLDAFWSCISTENPTLDTFCSFISNKLKDNKWNMTQTWKIANRILLHAFHLSYFYTIKSMIYKRIIMSTDIIYRVNRSSKDFKD